MQRQGRLPRLVKQQLVGVGVGGSPMLQTVGRRLAKHPSLAVLLILMLMLGLGLGLGLGRLPVRSLQVQTRWARDPSYPPRLLFHTRPPAQGGLRKRTPR